MSTSPYNRSPDLTVVAGAAPSSASDSRQESERPAARHTYDPARPFGPWLVAIANRRVVDGLRRQGRSRAREVALETEHETFAAPQANLAETASDGRVLRDAVEQLPPGQRDAIRMLKLQEMSLKEAAAVSGMTVAALKVATHRALKSLRKVLGRQDRRT